MNWSRWLHRAVPVSVWLLIAGVLLVAWGTIQNDFYLRILNIAAVFAIVIVPLDLLIGYMGYLPFGQAAFYGAGAYVVGNMTVLQYEHSFWLALVVTAVVVVVVGYLLSVPLFRLTGAHFAIGTLAVGQLASILFDSWESFTGGTFGIAGIPKPYIGNVYFDTNSRYFLLLAFFLYLAALSSWLLTRGRIGLALRAIRQDEVLAAARGLNVTRYKRLVFAFAAMWAGIAGALFAPLQVAIDPSSFTVQASMLFVLIAILGGTGTLVGPAVGALLYLIMEQEIQAFAEWNQLVLGGLLVLVVLLFKWGLWGAIQWVFIALRRLVQKKPPPLSPPQQALIPETAVTGEQLK